MKCLIVSRDAEVVLHDALGQCLQLKPSHPSVEADADVVPEDAVPDAVVLNEIHQALPSEARNPGHGMDVVFFRVTEWMSLIYGEIHHVLEAQQCPVIIVCDVTVPVGTCARLEPMMPGPVLIISTTGEIDSVARTLQNAIDAAMGVMS